MARSIEAFAWRVNAELYANQHRRDECVGLIADSLLLLRFLRLERHHLFHDFVRSTIHVLDFSPINEQSRSSGDAQ